MKELSTEEIEQRLKNLKTMSDVTSFTKDLVAPTIQRMLNAEMDTHLGYPPGTVPRGTTVETTGTATARKRSKAALAQPR